MIEGKVVANIPGKVLLLGGYSVLHGYPGLSIAVLDKNNDGVRTFVEESTNTRIVSAQFGIDANPKQMIDNRNRIVLTAYTVAKKYLEYVGVHEKHVKYKIDNSYIFGNPYEKTGLGSSAAATVSLITAVLEIHDVYEKDIAHKLSQIAHALATGKIGSGFDIATSIYGTNIYTRSDRSVLEDLGIKMSAEDIGMIIEKRWPKLHIVPFNFEYSLLVFNIKGHHTSTTRSVSSAKILAKKKPELYMSLIDEQAKIERKAINAIRNKQDDLVRRFIDEAREIHREMSDAVRKFDPHFTPIEPPEFTHFMDEVVDEGLAITSRCPGGGGYDSIVFVVGNDTKNTTADRNDNAHTIDEIKRISKKHKLGLEYIRCHAI